ncbi:MAG: metallophosphoesterase [Clostridia bacterium]|nr:metallophosphoesterase [Clostridia bacterium]
MKKFTALLLALITLFFCAVPAFAATDGEQNFVPVIRFVAASDTHVKEDNDRTADRIPVMLQTAYAAAEEDDAYSKLDAVLIAGDLTDRGTKPAFDKFWRVLDGSLKDGTRFIGVVAKNHDGYEMSRRDVHEYYSSLTGNDADFHIVINGYHFIGLSASDNDATHYDSKQLGWLKEQFDKATAENPDKPVFVTHHEHVRNTVYGSSTFDGWGVTYFTNILNQYPQVVDFSGHSHYPLNDPRSIWQGNFTAIGTGAIYYSEFTIDEFRAYDPPDCQDTGTFWIVEVDASGNMHLRGYDVDEGKQLCEYYINNPSDKANRDFTPAKQKEKSSAPEFEDGAALRKEQITDPTFDTAVVFAPVAASTDGNPVVLYRIKVKNSLGLTLMKDWVLPPYYRAIPQEEVEFSLENLPAGEYTITVTAENAYGMQSEPLTLKTEIEGKTGFAALASMFRMFFERIKTFFERLFS